jgi:hypothetical protein
MATLILNAYGAEKNGAFVSIALCIGGDAPFPSRKVEIKTAADCLAALETYKADATASGKRLAVSMMLARGDRKPNGFDKLKAARSYETVNLPE